MVDADRTLAVLGAGAIFGEGGLLDGEIRSATATAETDAEVLELPSVGFREWLDRHPTRANVVLRGLAVQTLQRLRATNELLRETVAWGLEVSGASLLSLASLAAGRPTARVRLRGGGSVEGRIVRVDDARDGVRLWFSDGSRVQLIAWHAVDSIEFDIDLAAVHHQQAEG
jgi:CRP-like cAMP-binding protein